MDLNSWLVRLQLVLYYPRNHKFKHSFQDCLNTICSCDIEVKTLFIICFIVAHERKIFLGNFKSALSNILEQNGSLIGDVLIFGNTPLDDSSNTAKNTYMSSNITSKIVFLVLQGIIMVILVIFLSSCTNILL